MSLGFRNLKKRARADARRRLTCKTQDPAKTNAKTAEDRVAEDRDSEATESSDGSKQYANNTKTGAVVTVRRAEVAAARRRATIGRAGVPITAADHAVGAGG